MNKKWKIWLANGILAMVASLFALVIAEVAVRIAAPQATSTSLQDRYGLVMHYPDITAYLPHFGHDVSINSAGMRDVEHEIEKPQGTFRILVLGDSFMEAYQVLLHESLPRLIEGDLADATGRQIEVINGGVSGWGTDDQLRYLEEYGLAYEPDLILVAMTLHNDVSDNLRQTWRTLENGELVDQPREPIPFRQYTTLRAKAFLAARLQLVRVWREFTHREETAETSAHLVSHVEQIFQDPPPENIAYGNELTERLLERIRDVAAANDAEVAITLIPLIYQLSDENFAEFMDWSQLTPDDTRPFKPQENIHEMGERLEIPVIDMLAAFRARKAEDPAPLYIDWDGHWNQDGHRLAADVVTEGLLENGLVR